MKATKVLIRRPVDMKPIPGYEGRYSITRDGRIWSHENTQHIADWSRVRKGKWLRMKPNNYGYIGIRLAHPDAPPRGHFHFVHRLVMAAWGTPPPSPLHQINHRDFDKANNHIDNLEWVLPRENIRHAIANGHHPRSNPKWRPSAKLTEAQVIEIRTRYTGKRGEQRALAREYGVHFSTINALLHRANWA